ncbi:hypothetical protein [Streptomyces sp. NBC_00207]|uniref:hypothetical protein n=1 Tax=unclassified Streptomyces TaxID=2593676 RepID=UPI0028886D58|nr:hypothetical protein [Streptomyces sp. DSM 41633]
MVGQATGGVLAGGRDRRRGLPLERPGLADGTGYELHPGDDIPFTIDLLVRPYAFLCHGK